jgi:hypothetical protein
MASRRGDTFDKRQRERRRQEKAAVKRSRRQGTELPNGPLTTTTTAEKPHNPSLDTLIEDFTPRTSEHRDLLEKFSMIKEHRKAGGIDNDTYELLRMEIFEELGLEV